MQPQHVLKILSLSQPITTSYKQAQKPRMACVPASLPLWIKDLSSQEPSRAGRASSVTVHPSAIGQVPAARPSSVKPAQLCESSLPLLSPLSPPLSLLCFPCSAPGSHQLSHHLQALAGTLVPPSRTSLEKWCEVGTVCIHYFFCLFCGSICRDLGPLPDVRIELEDPGRSQGLVPRLQHLPPPSPYILSQPFPHVEASKNQHPHFTAALWAGSDPSSPKESTSTVPSPSLGHLAAAGSCHLHQPHA